MNILFLTLLDFDSINERGIYTDLLRKFIEEGHTISIVSPVEKRKKIETKLLDFETHKILKLKIGNVQKTNIVEKGISTITLESHFIKGIKKYFSNERYDLILYTTPPITLERAINFVKNRDDAITYLMLKDIFPQNALDLGMLSQTGLKGIIYNHFKRKEKRLYELSNFIGCMSEANVKYLLKHNLYIDASKVNVCPNAIELSDSKIVNVNEIRKKYSLPIDKKIFMYGGNLGKPQCIPFIIECIEKARSIKDAYFLIVGSGTEFEAISHYAGENNRNLKVMSALPREDYERLLKTCDVGLIFLDYRFTIPNFPSRLLSYLSAGKPVLAATDENTDIKDKIEEGNFGIWVPSNDANTFCNAVKNLVDESTSKECGKNAKKYLIDNYSVDAAYDAIMQMIEMR